MVISKGLAQNVTLYAAPSSSYNLVPDKSRMAFTGGGGVTPRWGTRLCIYPATSTNCPYLSQIFENTALPIQSGRAMSLIPHYLGCKASRPLNLTDNASYFQPTASCTTPFWAKRRSPELPQPRISPALFPHLFSADSDVESSFNVNNAVAKADPCGESTSIQYI